MESMAQLRGGSRARGMVWLRDRLVGLAQVKSRFRTIYLSALGTIPNLYIHLGHYLTNIRLAWPSRTRGRAGQDGTIARLSYRAGR